MFYSDATKGFYSVNGDAEIPTDAVEITKEYCNALLEGQAVGFKIALDGNGYPVLTENVQAPLTLDELTGSAIIKRDQLLAVAAIRIAPLQDAVDLDMATAADVSSLKLWKQYRVSVNRVPDQSGFPVSISWPSLPA